MKAFFLKTLEKTLNQYLRLDPESEKRLRSLEGKVITLALSGIMLSFQLKILASHIHLQEPVQEPDVLIQGTPLFLLHLSLSKENRKLFFAEEVSIQGDLELGQSILDLFDDLEIDWEEQLSRFIGDVAAHEVGHVARRLKRLSKKTRETILQNINEYVHEEINLFPPREALQDFFQEIDDTRMAVDRLEKIMRGIQS